MESCEQQDGKELQRLRAAASSISALAPTDDPISTLRELNSAFTLHPRADVLLESGVVRLLLQTLVLTGNSDAPWIAGDRLLYICLLFSRLLESEGGANLLTECNAVDHIAAFLPCIYELVPVESMSVFLRVLETASCTSVLATAARRAALTNLLSFMRVLD